MSDKEVVFMVFTIIFFVVSITFTVIYVEVSVEKMIDLMTSNLNGLKV